MIKGAYAILLAAAIITNTPVVNQYSEEKYEDVQILQIPNEILESAIISSETVPTNKSIAASSTAEPLYIKNINEYEKQFKEDSYNGDKSDTDGYEVVKGSIPILISAPHSVKQWRDNTEKMQDTLTGSIVKILQEKTGCYVIYKTYNDMSDANYDVDSKYKDEMLRIIKENNIKLVLDIHGAASTNPFDIELGTDYGNNLLSHTEISNKSKNIFMENGIPTIYIDNYFKASSFGTIAKYISTNAQIPAMQIEINKIYRSPGSEDQNFIKLIDSLTKIILELNKGFQS